jgi:hypothetical protein
MGRHTMPGMLVDGEWKTERQWQNTDGRLSG